MGGVSEVSVDFGLSCGRIFDGGRVGNSISMGSLVALIAWEKGGLFWGSNLVMFFSNVQSTQKREREREREKVAVMRYEKGDDGGDNDTNFSSHHHHHHHHMDDDDSSNE